MKTEIVANKETGGFDFVWTTPGDNPRVIPCKTIDQAVTYARAFTDGIRAAQNMVHVSTMWTIPPEAYEATGKGEPA